MTIDDSESSSFFVFRKLIINNYKMHRFTELDLVNKPLIVISGANGSGKSQILEALILVIGYTPSRVSIGNKEELIGPFGDQARIQLLFSNPLIGEKRLFQSSDIDIEPFVNDQDSFIIELEIKKEGGFTRRIKKLDGNELVITRKQLHTLMKQVGIYEDTKMNFTEEGYLSDFAVGSPHHKLVSLLRATGLNETYNKYFESKAKLEKKTREHSPLLMQLEKEKNKLAKMEDDFKLINQKNELIKRFDLVKRELVWFDYERKKTDLNSIRTKIQELENKLHDIQKERFQTDKEKEEVFSSYVRLEKEKRNLNTKIDDVRSDRSFKQGILETKKNHLENKKNHFVAIEKREQKLASIGSENWLTHKKELETNLNSLKQEINRIDTEITNIDTKFKVLEKEKEKIDANIRDRTTFFGRLSKEERVRLNDCQTFRRKIDKTKYGSEILGPIFQISSIKSGFEKYENAIKTALGYSLFDFVATTHEAYDKAKEVYDLLKNELPRTPKLTVGRVLEQEGPKPAYFKMNLELKDTKPGIIDYAVNLIDAPYQVLEYLKKFRKTVIAKSSISANKLTDYALELRSNILTDDCTSYFLSREAFSHPPPILRIRLGSDIQSYKSIENLKERIDQIEREKEELVYEKFRLNNKKGEIQLKKREIERELLIFTKESDFSAELSSLLIEKEKLEEEIKEEELEIASIEKRIQQLDLQLNSLFELREKLSSEYESKQLLLQKLEENIRNYRQQEKNLLKTLNKLNVEFLHLEQELKNEKIKAEEIGVRPEYIREKREDIFAELNDIKGQLSLIEIQENISLETIEGQRTKVEKLEELIDKGNEYLKNLKNDVEKRLDQWFNGLQKTVDNLNGTLKYLLSEVFEEISLFISNYTNERAASLNIIAKTKNKNRSYRQLSGGEKTLIAQAIILSLHLISSSPLHVIDEFTQKLDKKNRAYAFSIAYSVYLLARKNRLIVPQFIFISPGIEDVKLNEEFSHNVLIETKVKKDG